MSYEFTHSFEYNKLFGENLRGKEERRNGGKAQRRNGITAQRAKGAKAQRRNGGIIRYYCLLSEMKKEIVGLDIFYYIWNRH